MEQKSCQMDLNYATIDLRFTNFNKVKKYVHIFPHKIVNKKKCFILPTNPSSNQFNPTQPNSTTPPPQLIIANVTTIKVSEDISPNTWNPNYSSLGYCKLCCKSKGEKSTMTPRLTRLQRIQLDRVNLSPNFMSLCPRGSLVEPL